MRVLSWRSMLVGMFGLTMVVSAGPGRAAPDPEAAKAHIEDLADQAITILDRDDLDNGDREKMFGEILRHGFDIDFIGRFTMGRFWKGATADEREEYLELFGDFVVQTYTRRLSTFAGEKIEITGTHAIDARDILVSSEIARPGEEPISTGWRVREGENGLKIIDLMVEGLSMAVTQRDEFASVLRRQGVDGLLQILAARTQRMSVMAEEG